MKTGCFDSQYKGERVKGRGVYCCGTATECWKRNCYWYLLGENEFQYIGGRKESVETLYQLVKGENEYVAGTA